MTSREFCYWLQGFFEINDAGCPANVDRGLIGERVEMIRKHLALVFKHEIDPSYPNQEALNKIHYGAALADGRILPQGGSSTAPPKMRC